MLFFTSFECDGLKFKRGFSHQGAYLCHVWSDAKDIVKYKTAVCFLWGLGKQCLNHPLSTCSMSRPPH